MYFRRTARAVFSGALLALLPVLGAQGGLARAQAPSGGPASNTAGGKIYTSKTVFHLPIKIDDRLRADLREVYLYVKDGTGPWLRKEAVPPTQTHFTFRVPHDGEYWFSVVTMDRHGHMTPMDVSKEPPGLMVVVDTRPAEAAANVPAAVNTAPMAPLIPPPMPTAPTAPPSLPAPVLPAPALPAPALPTAISSAPTSLPPIPSLPPLADAMKVASPPSSAFNQTSYSAPAPSTRGNRQLLNTTRATIDYRIDQVGPSGVGKVEVWLTADEGRTWQRYGEDADRRSPAEITLPGEGQFGIRLVVTNGNGFGGKAPMPGEAPSSTLEVDLTKPFAQLREIEPVGANGTVDIRWTASDKNLGAEPINLYYAATREGPWLPVATNLKNDGLFRWTLPRTGMAQFVLRLECADQAGNTTRCETQTPVVLDTTEPQVQVIAISGSHTPATRP